MILLAGGIYYTLTRYYFFNVHNLHAKQAMMEHLEYWYDQPFELLSTEFETVETKSDKLKRYVHIWTYTLADDKGEEFQAYVWLYSLVDKGTGDSHGPDYGSYISDTYAEAGEVSEPIVDVLACNEQIAVYPAFEDGTFKIIIRDIYNENVYEEITDDFPPVATGTGFIKEAKVLDRYTVYLDYYTGDSGNGDEWKEKKVVVLPKLEEHTN